MQNPTDANTDPAAYSKHGYCLYRDVLDAEAITAARRELDACIGNMPARMVVYKDGDHKEGAARPEQPPRRCLRSLVGVLMCHEMLPFVDRRKDMSFHSHHILAFPERAHRRRSAGYLR